MCKSGVKQITEKAKRSNRRLVELAERRQQRKLDAVTGTAMRHMESAIHSQEEHDKRNLRQRTAAIKAHAKMNGKQSGMARLAAARRDKAIAKSALHKAEKMDKGVKAQIRNGKMLAKKLRKEEVLAAARKKERQAMQAKLKVATAATAATEAKLNAKLGKLEKEDIAAAAAEKDAKRK